MPHNVASHTVNIRIAVKSRDFSVMAYTARHVLQEAVFYARKCGISFNSMLELVRNQNVAYHAAGV